MDSATASSQSIVAPKRQPALEPAPQDLSPNLRRKIWPLPAPQDLSPNPRRRIWALLLPQDLSPHPRRRRESVRVARRQPSSFLCKFNFSLQIFQILSLLGIFILIFAG